MSKDWLNEDVPIHKITFDEKGLVKDLEQIFVEPFFQLEMNEDGQDSQHDGIEFSGLAYVYVNEKDAVVIGEELCWGRMFLHYEKYNDNEKKTYFMKGDHTHVTKMGRKNYITWCDASQN
jgi:hypothetical protein